MRQNYTMLELVAALAVMALLTTCFFASLRSLVDMDKAFSAESRAILVLDNTLERAEFLKSPSSDELKRLFDSEYGKSPLKADDSIRKSFDYAEGEAHFRILKANGKPLAEVKVKCGR